VAVAVAVKAGVAVKAAVAATVVAVTDLTLG
jgi:hypothetical protein